MKTKNVLLSLGTLALASALVVIVIHHKPIPAEKAESAKVFQVRGQVLGINNTERTLRIAHEEIPGYMPAMTMPLPVKDPALLKKVGVGDNIQFELKVTHDDSWIAHIEKIQSDAPATQVAGSSSSLDDLEAERVHVGETVPDFSLVDQDGKTFHLKDLKGQAVVLTFVYTRCPLPNFCPLMSKNFAELQQRLSKEFPNKYHLLSISIDPEFDRPEVLKEYAGRYEARSADWTFATGDAEAIHFVASLMGLYYQKENGLVSHDLRTALIGPDGRLVHLWKSNVWTPYEIQRSVRETLTGSEDIAAR
jgi:protein SCO1/2